MIDDMNGNEETLKGGVLLPRGGIKTGPDIPWNGDCEQAELDDPDEEDSDG